MISGKRYHIIMAPSAHRIYKKFDVPLKEKVKKEVLKIAEEPYRYDELKGPLKGIRCHHFEYEKTEYRVAYRVYQDRIEVVLVKTRENFYQLLKRIMHLK